jgi:hypothetical protein
MQLAALLRLALLSLALCTALRAQHEVWVVSGSAGPGVDFQTIQAAIDAAADGDTVLVRPGTYPAFVSDGKGLQIVAARNTWPRILVGSQGSLVSNVPAASSFTLRGFSFDAGNDPAAPPAPAALRVVNCPGRVRIDLTHVVGIKRWMAIEACEAIALTRSGNCALSASDANLVLHDCTFISPFPQIAGEDALHAAELVRCTLDAQVAHFHGGVGGPSGSNCSVPGGNGGDGLRLVDSSAKLLHCSAQGGGAGGSWPSQGGGACPGAPGQAFALIASALIDEPGDSLTLVIGGHAIAREGENLTLQVLAKPGDFALLALGTVSAHTDWPALNGTLLLDPTSALLLPVGVVGTGSAQVGFIVPELGPGVSVRHCIAQGLFLKSFGWQLGSSTSLSLLDGAL